MSWLMKKTGLSRVAVCWVLSSVGILGALVSTAGFLLVSVGWKRTGYCMFVGGLLVWLGSLFEISDV